MILGSRNRAPAQSGGLGRGLGCLSLLLALLAGPAVAVEAPDAGVLRVTLLGTGTPRSVEAFGASTLIEAGTETLIFDTGRGAGIRLAQHLGNPGFAKFDRIFLTHLHSDHTVGLADLWLRRWIVGGKTSPLILSGPRGVEALVAGLRQGFAQDIHYRSRLVLKQSPTGANITVREFDTDGVVYEAGGVTVTAFEVSHGPVKPAYGYRIDYAGHSVVLSGDTSANDNLVAHGQGADVVIHEVFAVSPAMMAKLPQLKTLAPLHTSPEEAGAIFSSIGPALAVYSHNVLIGVSPDRLLARTRTAYTGRLVYGRDLMVINIGDEITIFPPDTGNTGDKKHD